MNTVKHKDSDSPYIISLVAATECAPHIKDAAPGVCSTQQDVKEMKNWLHVKKGTALEIVQLAMKKTQCQSESCLYKKIAGLQSVDDRFSPSGPWNSNNWLSNVDIDGVLEQYARKFPRFIHVQFQMRDFMDTGGVLGKVNWKTACMQDCLACIVNTDISTGGGEHWTAFFVDFLKHTVEYFDSAAQTPHLEFSEFAIKIAHELELITGSQYTDKLVTKVEHQMKNTECGVYSLYYVLSRLHGVSSNAFEYQRVPDETMTEFRKSLFRYDK